MWSTGRSEAALEAALPLPIEIRPMRNARRMRLRFDDSARHAQADLPVADQPPRGARLGARAARVDRTATGPRRAGRAVRVRRVIPIEGRDVRIAWDRRRAAHAAAGRRRTASAAGRRTGSPAGSKPSSSSARSTSCRGGGANMPRRPASTAAPVGSAMPRSRWGSCSSHGPDPPELAADPRPARSAALRRRPRGRASRASRPRARIQGARGAALRPRAGRGEGRAAALRAAGCDGLGGGAELAASRLALGCGYCGGRCAAAAAAGRPGRAPAASARRCRRGGPSAAAGDSPARGGGMPSGMPFSSTIGCIALASTSVSPYTSSSGVSCQSGSGTWVSNCSTGRLATATVMKSWKARAGAVPPCRPGDRPGVVAAHPHAGRQAARKADEPAILVGGGGAGLARDRAADLRGAAGAGEHRRLQQVGHFRGDPRRDQHPLFARARAGRAGGRRR